MQATAHEVVHDIVRWSDAAKDLAYEGLFLLTRDLSEPCIESEMVQSRGKEERSWADMRF